MIPVKEENVVGTKVWTTVEPPTTDVITVASGGRTLYGALASDETPGGEPKTVIVPTTRVPDDPREIASSPTVTRGPSGDTVTGGAPGDGVTTGRVRCHYLAAET